MVIIKEEFHLTFSMFMPLSCLFLYFMTRCLFLLYRDVSKFSSSWYQIIVDLFVLGDFKGQFPIIRIIAKPLGKNCQILSVLLLVI